MFNEYTVGVLKKEIILGRTASLLIGTVVFTFLTILGAFICIPLPFTPVPITAQTFFVFLAGLCLGKRWASLSQTAYLLLGAAGMNVFAGGGGFLRLSGPTGGYLLGFVACSWIIGRLVELKRNINLPWILFSVFAGSAVLYLSGITHLMFVTKVSFAKALYLGFIPFIPGYIFKMGLASWIFWKFKDRIKKLY